MSAHTPGPWHHIDNSWEMSTVYDEHERVIAEVPIDGMCDEHTQDVYEPIKDANARLLAAAPELYEALEAIGRAIHDRNYFAIEAAFNAGGFGSAALAKVTGKAM